MFVSSSGTGSVNAQGSNQAAVMPSAQPLALNIDTGPPWSALSQHSQPSFYKCRIGPMNSNRVCRHGKAPSRMRKHDSSEWCDYQPNFHFSRPSGRVRRRSGAGANTVDSRLCVDVLRRGAYMNLIQLRLAHHSDRQVLTPAASTRRSHSEYRACFALRKRSC